MRTLAIVLILLQELTMTALAADAPRVDYSYSFAPPHRVTAALPDSGHKTLLDLQPGSLRVAWSYEDITGFPLAAFVTPQTRWDLLLTPQVDGHPFARSTWKRLDGWLPALDNSYEGEGVDARLEAIGAADAMAIRLTWRNTSARTRTFTLVCDSRSWGENPAWMDPDQDPGDHLLAGWNERADRVLVFGLGADAWTQREDRRSPGPRTMVMVWTAKPGETRIGWIVRPYQAYSADLKALRARDWAAEVERGKQTWKALLARTAQVSIPDQGVLDAFRACLADLFVMREPIAGGGVAAAPGTEVYRAANTHEAAVVAIALDQMGLHREAERGYRWCLRNQGADGNWNDPNGWGHTMWSCAGFKSWAAMEHYRLTGDRAYLAQVYPHMRASSLWQETQRRRTRAAGGAYPGLMPRGFGDCGLKDDDDMYGVFLPHNIWAVYADRAALEAAEALGRAEDVPVLRRIYEEGKRDLVAALGKGAIQEKDHRWIPGVPGKTSGSRWGALNVYYPCGLLPADDPLVTGTLHHIEANMSPGGIPLNTGWLANGMWVAITLDNVAEVRLAMGDGDAAVRYLYACLNHGTPLVTWCEERAPEAGTATCTGDRQHLWTPVAVVRCVRDMLVTEREGGLDLALGTGPQWLTSGRPVGIADAPTHYGKVSYSLRYDAASRTVTGEVRFARDSRAPKATLHVRLPGGLRIRSVDPASGAAIPAGGTSLSWSTPRGTRRFTAQVAD